MTNWDSILGLISYHGTIELHNFKASSDVTTIVLPYVLKFSSYHLSNCAFVKWSTTVKTKVQHRQHWLLNVTSAALLLVLVAIQKFWLIKIINLPKTSWEKFFYVLEVRKFPCCVLFFIWQINNRVIFISLIIYFF